MNPFVPADFEVPEKLETTRFRARMLTVDDVVKDYDALTRRLILPEALTPAEAGRYLSDHVGTWYDGAIVNAFMRVLKTASEEDNLKEIRISVEGLRPGMVVTRDFVNSHGVLVVPRGHRLDEHAIATLERIAEGTEGFVLFVQR